MFFKGCLDGLDQKIELVIFFWYQLTSQLISAIPKQTKQDGTTMLNTLMQNQVKYGKSNNFLSLEFIVQGD